MKYTTERPFADPEKAARRLIQHGADQDGVVVVVPYQLEVAQAGGPGWIELSFNVNGKAVHVCQIGV